MSTHHGGLGGALFKYGQKDMALCVTANLIFLFLEDLPQQTPCWFCIVNCSELFSFSYTCKLFIFVFDVKNINNGYKNVIRQTYIYLQCFHKYTEVTKYLNGQ